MYLVCIKKNKKGKLWGKRQEGNPGQLEAPPAAQAKEHDRRGLGEG